MENPINYLNYAIPFSIIVNILVSISIALQLYSNAPEKNDLGFNKYWQTLMMDSYPSGDKNLLVYDDTPERLNLFKVHRAFSVGTMSFIVINVVLIFLFK